MGVYSVVVLVLLPCADAVERREREDKEQRSRGSERERGSMAKEGEKKERERKLPDMVFTYPLLPCPSVTQWVREWHSHGLGFLRGWG